MKKTFITAVLIVVAAIGSWFGFHGNASSVGSVGQGGSYKSIETAPSQTNATYLQSSVVQTFSGTLGSVIVTGAGTGNLTLYDATTSDVTKRAGATTTLRVLAHLPASAAAGTYTFDVDFYNGLVAEFLGAQGTTTITYR